MKWFVYQLYYKDGGIRCSTLDTIKGWQNHIAVKAMSRRQAVAVLYANKYETSATARVRPANWEEPPHWITIL